MAKRARSATADYAVYIAIRVLVAVLQALPVRIAFAVSDALAALAHRIDRRHREVAADNLRHAFPEKSPREIDILVRGCYRHCVRIVVEMALLPRKFRLSNWPCYGRLRNGAPQLEALLDRDRPTLIVTAHFGNWELAGYAIGAFGFRSYAIARVLDNPFLEDYFKRFRQGTGQAIIAKNDDFPRLEAALRLGGKVATLADQDAGPRGVFVDFFGRPASAHKAVALMAMEFNAVMLVIGVPRIGQFDLTRTGFGYEIVCEDVIDPAEYAGRPDAVKAITARYHAALERMIRRHPEQYFWLHRRWKSQPAARRATAPRLLAA
jgi:Kdo2-lipid IVA lauroyltransferase/acyltransferase